jgi:hypothetical protein
VSRPPTPGDNEEQGGNTRGMRTRRATPAQWAGHLCPENPDHGPLLAMRDGTGWYCPAQPHDGRPATHPEGKADATRAFFSTDQAAAGAPA